jgi:dipeptidyl aminopeptidase/acylaminoacyl peptidase
MLRSIYRVEGQILSPVMADNAVVALQETATAPRKIVSIRLSDGMATTIYDPNPQLKDLQIGSVEKLEWRDRFGNETFGYLVYPPGYVPGRRYPMVVVQYRSGGFLSGGVGNEYPIYPLAARGFVVLSFDRPEDRTLQARYDTNSLDGLKALEHLLWKNGYTQRQSLSALEIILDTLDRRGVIDPSRVGITGLSDGAETVQFALFNSKRFAAAAHSGRMSPSFYYLLVNDSYRSLIRAMFTGRTAADVAHSWSQLSMTDHIKRVNTPLLIQVADRELVSATDEFVALKDAGKPVEAYVFPDEYHVKWQPQHKRAVAERTIDWFRFWLMGEEDPTPEKIEQYARWQKLKMLSR